MSIMERIERAGIARVETPASDDQDGSFQGVLIFCTIGLLLTLFAALFGSVDTSMWAMM